MDKSSLPVYTGVRKHVHPTGFSLWIPGDWTTFALAAGHEGIMVGPHAGVLETIFLAEMVSLPFAVKIKEASALRKGFEAGLHALPGVEIETTDEQIGTPLMLFDARFTFLEGDARRKRWVRTLYADTRQLRLIAQGSTPAEFDYWLPMFFNIMHTFELYPMQTS